MKFATIIDTRRLTVVDKMAAVGHTLIVCCHICDMSKYLVNKQGARNINCYYGNIIIFLLLQGNRKFVIF